LSCMEEEQRRRKKKKSNKQAYQWSLKTNYNAVECGACKPSTLCGED
jgi:hypothetical protein